MKNITSTLLLFLSVFLSGEVFGGELEIGRLRVAVWPEYDSNGVLFIYDGRFKDEGDFPAETTFLLPPGSVISDACSLSPKGQHFCQLYKQKKADGADEITIRLPYPNFYLSFHTDPFGELKPGGARRLSHAIRTSHMVDTLEVDVQEPLSAEGFRITAPEGFSASERKGFRHHERTYEAVSKGARIDLSIEYSRRVVKPSVDEKYSSMSETKGDAPYEAQRGVMGYVYAAIAAGAVLIAVIAAALIKRGRG